MEGGVYIRLSRVLERYIRRDHHCGLIPVDPGSEGCANIILTRGRTPDRFGWRGNREQNGDGPGVETHHVRGVGKRRFETMQFGHEPRAGDVAITRDGHVRHPVWWWVRGHHVADGLGSGWNDHRPLCKREGGRNDVRHTRCTHVIDATGHGGVFARVYGRIIATQIGAE